MSSAGEQALLRPLSLGEIFDRALTLYVRNFVPFTLIVAVLVVPLSIANYFIGLHESSSFAQILAQIQHPSKTPPSSDAAALEGWNVLLVLLAVLLNAFTIVAIAAAVGRLYRRELPDWRACWNASLRRTGAILIALLCELGVFVVVLFAGAFALTGVFVAAFLLVRGSPALGIVAFVAAIIIGIAWFVGIVLCYLSFGFAFSALGVENASIGAAIGSGFSRVFNRGELLRAVLVCLALAVIYLGLSIVSVSIAAVFEAMSLHLLTVLVGAVLSLVMTAALGVLLVVYYFDVRVRREGLDMQAEIESLRPLAASP